MGGGGGKDSDVQKLCELSIGTPWVENSQVGTEVQPNGTRPQQSLEVELEEDRDKRMDGCFINFLRAGGRIVCSTNKRITKSHSRYF